MKRYTINSTLNTRDLGGYAIKNGGFTAFERFLRSDVPLNLTEEDIEFFKNMGVTDIIDLRSEAEAKRYPCSFKGREGFNYLHCPVYRDGILPEAEKDISPSYYDMAVTEKTLFPAWKAIANAKGAVLYHCTAGKDRTGIVSAILLMLAGVSRVDITADYQVSATYIKPAIDIYRKEEPNLPAYAGQSKPEYIEGFMDRIISNFDSAEAYLKYIGLDQEEINCIKSRLTGVKK